MPVSADTVEIAIALETVYGTAPDSGWVTLPVTSEGLAANVSTTLSNLMNPDRQVLDSILAGVSAEGDIASELVICPAFKILMQSAMSSLEADVTPTITAVKDPANMKTLKLGLKHISFSVRKKMVNPSNTNPTTGVKGAFIDLYQMVTGCVVNTFALNSSPGEAITYTCGVIGKAFSEGKTTAMNGIPDGVSVAPTSVNVLRGPDTTDLQFGGAAGDPFVGDTIATRCFGAFGYNINNNYRGIQCIGTLGNAAVVLGRCEVSLSATIHLWDNALLAALLDQSEHTFTFRAQNPKAVTAGVAFLGMFSSTFPRIKVASNTVVAGGTGTDMVNELTANALYDATDKTTLEMSYGDGLPATT